MDPAHAPMWMWEISIRGGDFGWHVGKFRKISPLQIKDPKSLRVGSDGESFILFALSDRESVS